MYPDMDHARQTHAVRGGELIVIWLVQESR